MAKLFFTKMIKPKKALHLFHTNKIHLYKQIISPNYFYDHANQNIFVPRMPSYLLKLLFALWKGRHRSGGVLQPLFGLGIEGQSRGWRRQGVLHHWRWNVYGVRRNWYTFAPSQFHFKIHYHFAWNGQHLAFFFITSMRAVRPMDKIWAGMGLYDITLILKTAKKTGIISPIQFIFKIFTKNG